MLIVPGQEGIVVSLTSVSIHGVGYVDVLVADPEAPDDPARRLNARLGPESIVGDVSAGDRVRVEGFLRVVTRIEKIG